MAYQIREVTFYEVYNDEDNSRYTLVETSEEAEKQKQEAEDNARTAN